MAKSSLVRLFHSRLSPGLRRRTLTPFARSLKTDVQASSRDYARLATDEVVTARTS